MQHACARMRVCSVCVCVSVSVPVSVSVSIFCVYVYVYVCFNICACVCANTCLQVCVLMSTPVSVSVSMYISVPVFVHACVPHDCGMCAHRWPSLPFSSFPRVWQRLVDSRYHQPPTPFNTLSSCLTRTHLLHTGTQVCLHIHTHVYPARTSTHICLLVLSFTRC